MDGTRLYSYLFLLSILIPLPQTGHTASLNGRENKRRHHISRQKSSSADYSNLPLKPSMVMIPFDLHETVNKELDPDSSDLDEVSLLDRMGADYDRQFMSISQPSDMKTNPNGTLEYKFKKGQRPLGDMPPSLDVFEHRSIKLSDDGPEIKLRASRKTRRKLQKFLWAYSYCPVRYKWKELSTRFWPRWIKVGSCENRRSCSIPAGMQCQPSKMMNITLLRFYCPSLGAKRTCQWIKIQYPILEECSCGCQTYASD